jgi:hypothetical protein
MRPFFTILAFKGPISTNIQAFAAYLSQIIVERDMEAYFRMHEDESSALPYSRIK